MARASEAIETSNNSSWSIPTLERITSAGLSTGLFKRTAPVRTPSNAEEAVVLWAEQTRKQPFLGESTEQLHMLKALWGVFYVPHQYKRPSECWAAIGFQVF